MADESGAPPPSAPPASAPPAGAPPAKSGPSSPVAPAASKPTAPAAKLLADHVSVSYIGRAGDAIQAVDDVSFRIEDKPGCGEIVVFLGPSGCGKSTLLKCIAGLMKPTQGTVQVDGKVVDGTSRERGMVFQTYTSFAWLTVQGNVEYGLRLAKVPKAERARLALEALKDVGLADFAHRYPKELSGGMKQRVAIARTLVNRPRLVLMDEPFGALDPQTRWGMQTLLLDISKKLDNTIVFVTHDVSEAIYLADTIFILSPRPAKILHRLDVPVFTERDLSVKQSAAFRSIESQILELLHGSTGNFRIS